MHQSTFRPRVAYAHSLNALEWGFIMTQVCEQSIIARSLRIACRDALKH